MLAAGPVRICSPESCYDISMWQTVSVVVLLLAVVLALWFGTHNALGPIASARFTWDVEPAGIRLSDHAPLNSVALVTQTTTYPSGVYPGTCQAIDQTQATLLPGELSAIICLWNGSGSEIGVFESGPTREVRMIERDDATSTLGYRNPFDTRILFQLNTND